MNEIKFRAYVESDIIEGRPAETYQVVGLDWDDDGIVDATLFSLESLTFHTLEGKHFKLIQYIDRKDEDGREVYEGDLVLSRNRSSCIVWEVYWDVRVCQYRLCSGGDRQWDKTQATDWIRKVIGGVHANPQLPKIGIE